MIRIFIFDKDREGYKQLADFLVYRGYKVYGAHDENKALELIKHNAPQIVMIDVEMGNAGVLKVLGFLREFFPETRIIKIKGLRTKDKNNMFSESEDDNVLVKPFNFDNVEQTIIEVVNRIVEGG